VVSKKDDTMSSMSNTRKDIAARLGSAQPNDRPGKKAKFGRIDSMLDYAKKLDSQLDSIRSDMFLLQTRRLGRVIGGLIRAQKSNDESQLDALSNELNFIRSEANKVCNEKFSRPGVKAKFEATPALKNFVRQWNRLEDQNYHPECVLLISKFIGTPQDVANSQRLVKIMDKGFDPSANVELGEIRDRLWKQVRAKYGNETVNKLMG
jgi:hypothetical protein